MQTTLHRDKDQFAIVTTAETEDEFRRQWAEGLAIEIGKNPDDAAFVIERYTAEASEIVCKYRGYKSNVVERKTIIAGHIDPHAEQAIIGRQAAETNGKGDTTKVPVPA